MQKLRTAAVGLGVGRRRITFFDGSLYLRLCSEGDVPGVGVDIGVDVGTSDSPGAGVGVGAEMQMTRRLYERGDI